MPKATSTLAICVAAALLTGGLLFNGYARLKGGPDIVVYLDKDAKQPTTLPLPETTVVAGERAALWWTVFLKAQENQTVHDARYTADDAVRTVYGEVK